MHTPPTTNSNVEIWKKKSTHEINVGKIDKCIGFSTYGVVNTTCKANLELLELVVGMISWIKISYLKCIHDLTLLILIYINHLSKLHCDNKKYTGWYSIINLYFDIPLCILEIDIDLLHGHMHIDVDGKLFIFTNIIFNVFF